jgi:hypothetical protein
MCKSEGVLWQGTSTHIAITFKAKTPYPSPHKERDILKKFFVIVWF